MRSSAIRGAPRRDLADFSAGNDEQPVRERLAREALSGCGSEAGRLAVGRDDAISRREAAAAAAAPPSSIPVTVSAPPERS